MTNLHDRTGRLREAVVPGRLAEAMPDWLTEAVRPKPAPVPWGAMVRAALAVCVPLAVGIVAGRRDIWLLLAIGGLTGTVIDTSGPYVVRVKRAVIAGVFGGGAGLVIGMLIHNRGWVAVASLVVVAGVSALISRLGSTASVTGLQLLVFAVLGLGPFGALRPWWHVVLGYAAGIAWALLLLVPGWLRSPRSAEQSAVADVYHALADDLRAIGTDRAAQTQRAVRATLNSAYDTLLTARATAGGQSRRMTHLMAVLNAGSRVYGAVVMLRREGTRPPPLAAGTLDRLADAIAAGGRDEDGGNGRGRDADGPRPADQQSPEPQPDVPPLRPAWSSSPGSLELRDALAALARTIAWTPATPPEPPPRTPLRERARTVLGTLLDQLRGGRLAWTFTIRLMVCVGLAAVASEVLPLQRSYWVVLTVAIVVKPDNGSVFARALQRGIGTIVGAVLGAVILAAVPYGPWLLFPMAVLAAGQPYGRLRNFGLGATFMTPLIVLLIDLLAPAGWRLPEERLVDTLLGCAIVLLVGYATWPSSWHSHLPRQFAATLRDICRSMESALIPDPDPAARGRGWQLRRQAYRALGDLNGEYQRAMSEPAAVSRRASAWWPAIVALDEVVDAATAARVAISRGEPAPSPDAVHQLTAALATVADAIDAGVPPRVGELPDDEALKPVTDPVRPVLSRRPERPAQHRREHPERRQDARRPPGETRSALRRLPRPDGSVVNAAPQQAWALMQRFVEAHNRRGELGEALGFRLGGGRGKILFQLRDGPVTLGQLAEVNGVDAPYATLIVDKLEAHGLVERRPHPDDRRRKLVTLTAAGHNAIATADAILLRPPAAVTNLPADDLEQLTGLLTRLLDADAAEPADPKPSAPVSRSG